MMRNTGSLRALALILSGWVVLAGPTLAKPPLADSQESPASTCIDYGDTSERLVDICREALGTAGASLEQRLDMMDSLGRALYRIDRDDEARAVFDEMLALDPGSLGGHVGLGWLDYDADDYAAAARHFETAMVRAPAARVLAGLGASRYYADEIDAEAALLLFDAALAISPEYGWVLNRKGWALSDLGRMDEAADAFRSALDVDPEDAGSLYGLAFVLSEIDLWEEALDPVNRALEIAPDYARALSRRSLIHYYLGNIKMALKDAEATIAVREDWSEGYVRKARAMARLGQRQAAFDLLAQTEARIGADAFLIYWHARLLLDEGRTDDALTEIRRNTDSDEVDFHDHLLLAQIALERDDGVLARAAIDKALAARPEDNWALFYAARVLLAERDFEAAEAGFDAAVAAGLPESQLSEFLTALIAEGRMVQAIRMRARYAIGN